MDGINAPWFLWQKLDASLHFLQTQVGPWITILEHKIKHMLQIVFGLCINCMNFSWNVHNTFKFITQVINHVRLCPHDKATCIGVFINMCQDDIQLGRKVVEVGLFEAMKQSQYVRSSWSSFHLFQWWCMSYSFFCMIGLNTNKKEQGLTTSPKLGVMKSWKAWNSSCHAISQMEMVILASSTIEMLMPLVHSSCFLWIKALFLQNGSRDAKCASRPCCLGWCAIRFNVCFNVIFPAMKYQGLFISIHDMMLLCVSLNPRSRIHSTSTTWKRRDLRHHLRKINLQL